MSKAIAQRTIKFINKVGTYTAYLQSSQGDLWQTYSVESGAYTNIVPDYASTRPVLYFVCISSRVSGISNVNGYPLWYFGNTKLNEDPSTPGQGCSTLSSGSINGVRITDIFELVAPSAGQPYYGLRIKRNLVDVTQGASISIKAVGKLLISATGTTDDIQAQTSVSITPATSNGIHVQILDITPVSAGVIGRNFTFTNEEETITMRADTYQGSTQLTQNLTYQWQSIVAGVWTNISGETSQQLTISENDVMTYAQFRCIVYENSVQIGIGTANIMDATDPFVIDPGVMSGTKTILGVVYTLKEDETIEETTDIVAYCPKIISRDSGTEQTAFTNQGFYFNYKAGDGTDQTPSGLSGQAVSDSSNYPVNFDICQSCGDISVIIESVADLKDYN